MAAVMNDKPLAPPHALYAEQAVLGVLMGRPELLDSVVGRLKPQDYYVREHQILFDTMLQMHQSRSVVDFVGVQDRLNHTGSLEKVGGVAYLGQLIVQAPSGGNLMQHIGVILEMATRRKVMSAAESISGRAAGNGDLAQGTTEGVEELMALLRDDGQLQEPEHINSVLISVIDDIEKRASGEVEKGISTGFSDIDTIMQGGMKRGDLIILAGRPSMGKTSLGMQVAANVAMTKLHTMIFTLEMSKKQIVERMLAQVGRIEYSRIVSGNLRDEDYGRLTEAIGKVDEAPMFIEDTGGLTIQEIAAKARMQVKKIGPLSLIVVDYLQIMGYTGKAANRSEQLSEMSRQFKALAKELGCPVIVLSQLNRDVEKRLDKRPIMSDLRESGAIEQDADTIIMMYRDEYYNKDSDFKGQAEAIVRKQRNGEVGTVGLAFEGHMVRFADLSTGHY